MTVWVARVGGPSEDEEFALKAGCIILPFAATLDLKPYDTKDAIRTAFTQLEPHAPLMRIANIVGALWRFRLDIQIGDIVLMPRRRRSDIAVGVIRGMYKYEKNVPENRRHQRTVEWVERSVLRTKFKPEVLRGIASPAYNYELRIQAINTIGELLVSSMGEVKEIDKLESNNLFETDIEETARDIIRQRIEQLFGRHHLELLVEDVLIAQGFATVHQEQKGADEGVDIFASHGPYGFGYPRICVQVKSGTSQIGAAVVRDLMGSVTEHKADLGLLVAWGGFSTTVLKDARVKFFKIRLWSQEELIDALLANYENLPDRSQNKLKLRQMWIPLPLVES